jgi:ABC-2 type transport system ATP-binding protein
VIRVRGLTRAFEGVKAIEGVSFDVEAGEIFGFLGPNGAGKTTTIRILATLSLQDAGSAHILGHDVTLEPEKVRDVMGYMPDAWGVYPGITVVEYLDFFAAAYGIRRRDRARALGDVMALTDLEPLRGKLVETLSKGMKQRLCLAKTLIHDPRLLILDEPANGLDPRARIEFRALLRELQKMGKTILISSHILTELSDLVTSVGIIEKGRMLMAGSIETILRRLEQGDAPTSVALAGEPAAPAADAGPLRRYTLRTTEASLRAANETLLARPDVQKPETRGEREVAFAIQGAEEQVAAIVQALVQAGVPVLALREARTDLEQVFMQVTRGQVQ